uniref:Uncharacterized protein n=1 Tax=Phenylobacterium glaciei TaxID=2803784 RepID=A0A974P1G6_9CAUL|nr:hypothetical protein JKL49_21465 [Phenylobacterium glaciei]
MAINGEYDRPNARTHRMARELADFTNLVLPGKGHLSAMMAGFIPDEYVEGYAAFVARNDRRRRIVKECNLRTNPGGACAREG